MLLPAGKNLAMSRNTVDYSVHANIIYRFTKYVDWPDNKKTGEFVIGVIGEPALVEELTTVTKNKKVGNQPIVVRNFQSNAASYNCHILFVGESESKDVPNIVEVTKSKSILIISEKNGLVKRGSCINFVVVGESLKLEFGVKNIETRDMKIASELLDLGTIVR
jgi:hypothetical protein